MFKNAVYGAKELPPVKRTYDSVIISVFVGEYGGISVLYGVSNDRTIHSAAVETSSYEDQKEVGVRKSI